MSRNVTGALQQPCTATNYYNTPAREHNRGVSLCGNTHQAPYGHWQQAPHHCGESQLGRGAIAPQCLSSQIRIPQRHLSPLSPATTLRYSSVRQGIRPQLSNTNSATTRPRCKIVPCQRAVSSLSGSATSSFLSNCQALRSRICKQHSGGGGYSRSGSVGRRHGNGVRCQGDEVPWWQELLGEVGIGKRRKGAKKRWGEGSDRREGRRRDEPPPRPEVPRSGGSTIDELAGRPRGSDPPPRRPETWKPLGGASRFQYPLDENFEDIGFGEDGFWESFRGTRKDRESNAWGGGQAKPWWERRKKKGLGGLLGWFGRGGKEPPKPPARDFDGRPLLPRGGGNDSLESEPLEAEPLTESERELDETLDRLVNYPKPPGQWVEWLDDSYSNKYSDYVGGSGSGWFEEQNEWVKGGNPRVPPDIPERGMSRTIKEMVLRIFEPRSEVEDDLAFEERVFRFTTQETAKFLLTILAAFFASDWVIHDFVLVPFMKRYTEEVPLVAKAFDLREKQKLDIVQRLKLERQRVRFEAEIGKAPPLSEKEMREHMREEALHLREEIREENRSSFSSILSDFVAFLVALLVLVLNPKRVALVKLTGQRIFTNISDTGKAFIIILLTDIFLGYHSENGWETLVELFLEHYGLEVDQHSIYIFVSTVPVTIDAVFKLWVFRYLSKLSPSAAATFKTMNRH